MRIYTWQSAPNAQGWKRARTCDSTYVLHNVKTGKIIDKGFTHVDLPNEAGWVFVEFGDENDRQLFNVTTERFLETDNYSVLSKPNSTGWMTVRKNGVYTFYNIYQKAFSDIKCKSAQAMSKENWTVIELNDGFTYANPQLNVVLQTRVERDYYLSWQAIYTEYPESSKYFPTAIKKNDDESE